MSTERKTLRADLLAAVATARSAHAPLAGCAIISAWTLALDPSALPVIGVSVPTERRDPAAQDTIAQDFQAVVVVKMTHKGGDGPQIEDALDDAAEALADPIEMALMTTTRAVALVSSAIDITGQGSTRVGTLTLTFGVQTWRARITP